MFNGAARIKMFSLFEGINPLGIDSLFVPYDELCAHLSACLFVYCHIVSHLRQRQPMPRKWWWTEVFLAFGFHEVDTVFFDYDGIRLAKCLNISPFKPLAQ